ncbi:MAG: hypothetical protein P8X74_16165 [Reinekea sp.]
MRKPLIPGCFPKIGVNLRGHLHKLLHPASTLESRIQEVISS